jgi:hypothetical protein
LDQFDTCEDAAGMLERLEPNLAVTVLVQTYCGLIMRRSPLPRQSVTNTCCEIRFDPTTVSERNPN